MSATGGGRADAERGMTPSPLRDLAPEQRTLPALLTRQARLHGERPLLRIGETRRDCRQMADAVAAAAGRLAAAGIGPGDRCALMCANRVELLDLVLGCAWLGAIAVPLNTALRGAGLRHQLTDSGACGLVVDGELLPVLDGLAPAPELRFVWALDGVGDGAPAGYPLTAMLDGAPPAPAAPVGPGDSAAILYTSGTSGVAKGVCCPHAQFHWWGVLVSETLGIREGDVLTTCLPLFHTNALNAFVQALVAGATFDVQPRFSASRFWERLAASQATVTYLLGAMVSILLQRPPGRGDRAHHARVALAPGSPEPVFRAFRERFGITLVEGYGSTETNCPISVAPGRQRPGWMGQVRAGFHARVVDADDAEVPDGTPGELVLRHDEPFAFATGYFGNDAATVRAWRNLWFHTGDQVVRDGDGWLRFVDRLKDAIRRRGENISSFEVEQALVGHPDVAAVAAYPLASALGEDEVAVAIVARDGQTVDGEALVRWCEPRLAYFAIPRYITVLDALPVTENGKVRKARLRERGVTAQTWDREAAGVVVSRAPAASGGR